MRTIYVIQGTIPNYEDTETYLYKTSYMDKEKAESKKKELESQVIKLEEQMKILRKGVDEAYNKYGGHTQGYSEYYTNVFLPEKNKLYEEAKKDDENIDVENSYDIIQINLED